MAFFCTLRHGPQTLMTMQVTHGGQRWSNAAEDSIEVVDSDPSWPSQFVTESCAIKKVLHPLKPRIEHFGSTAIPNLPAKLIIDIFIIVGDVSVWPRLVPRFRVSTTFTGQKIRAKTGCFSSRACRLLVAVVRIMSISARQRMWRNWSSATGFASTQPMLPDMPS